MGEADKGKSMIRPGLASAVLKIYCLLAGEKCNAFCLHVKYRQSTDHERHCTDVDIYARHRCALFVGRAIRTPTGSDALAKWSENSTVEKRARGSIAQGERSCV